ncbi:MAG: DedA family protein [Actinobacteria bacterium]|nr:DedA family protein [Actinomycetota bacterium]
MNPLDAKDIVATLGTIGVLATLFIETGLLVGLFLPGDSLLFVAGIAASGTAKEVFGNQLSYTQLLIWAPIAATVGSQCGHWLGAKYGRPFFDRPNSRFFNQERVAQTERWLMKYGLGKALILSHFIPFVRTLINPLCGIIGIPAKKFFIWNIIGSYIWTVSLITAGYLLGERLEGSVDKYLLPIVALIIALSLAPIAIEFLKDGKKKRSTED